MGQLPSRTDQSWPEWRDQREHILMEKLLKGLLDSLRSARMGRLVTQPSNHDMTCFTFGCTAQDIDRGVLRRDTFVSNMVPQQESSVHNVQHPGNTSSVEKRTIFTIRNLENNVKGGDNSTSPSEPTMDFVLGATLQSKVDAFIGQRDMGTDSGKDALTNDIRIQASWTHENIIALQRCSQSMKLPQQDIYAYSGQSNDLQISLDLLVQERADLENQLTTALHDLEETRAVILTLQDVLDKERAEKRELQAQLDDYFLTVKSIHAEWLTMKEKIASCKSAQQQLETA
ncbi:hypothetical protein PV08_11693 [Exophiala spinifera]|uniref:Uncharacterized protein n=1 Tax=Exophiala spinifera TaxID=91928 RepID=A0A0D1ZA72_9EURO|nr:uncharacterized protein PV08_11693 [Exophiala spinifera]KIW09917.1 hypothetical protein PV08_11693 [Exophiala spinifera]